MSEILNVAYVIVSVVLLFGAAVFVHEFGHFWMARRRGLKVEGFAIGFGPKILSWKRDGIEYSWRWIPAGGFVKLPQMITSEALEGESGSADEKVPPAAPLSKILVAIAGPLMNMIFGFAIAGEPLDHRPRRAWLRRIQEGHSRRRPDRDRGWKDGQIVAGGSGNHGAGAYECVGGSDGTKRNSRHELSDR